MRDLNGKVGVVTGAASGIGRAVAERLVSEGMKVVLADVEEAALGKAVAQLAEGGGTVIGVPTDVSDAASVDDLAKRTLAEFGAVNLVHNNAGVATGGTIWELSVDDWQWVLGVNLWGVIHGVRSFVPHLIEAGEGHVVNTASMAGVTTAPFMGPYTVSKHGVVAISEMLHKELTMAAHPVGVSVLCPGWVKTRIGESDRNRPDELQKDAAELPAGDMARQVLQSMLEAGMAPSEVAGQVVDAVKDGRFWIFTHPWKEMIETRVSGMLEGRNPVADFFPT
jgi:NAD(P)-dependent dehydrogenase (short-subunit alcohol dehydrogenase family)